MMAGYRNYLRWGHLVDEEGRPIPPEREEVLEEMVKQRFTLGGPERCLADIAMLRETLRLDCLVMKAKFPGLSHRNVMDSLRLFGERVLPNVQH